MKISFRFPATLSSEATRAQRRRSLLLAVIGIAVLPLAWRGPSCGQDFDFHLQNWLEMARSWRQGVIYPHWAASPNLLAGEPRFVFYPPLSRFLGAALGCVLPWSWTPLAFTIVCLLGAGWAFYAMVREWAGADNAALGACVYVVNPYMMFVAYERGAMAELLAAVWIPLLVLYALRARKSLMPLALTVGAIWLTNAPAAVMGCYMLAVLVMVATVQQRSWKIPARAAGGVALGLALAGFWLIPAIYEQRWVQIKLAVGPLMRVEDSFLFGYPIAGPDLSSQDLFDVNYHNQVLRLASWIVVALMIGTLVAAWFSWRRTRRLWLPLVIVGMVVCAVQFRLSEVLWRVTPELGFLQFPWRWMLVLGMIFAALVALALRPEPPTRRGIAARALLILLVAAGMAALASTEFWQPCDEEDNVAAQIQTFHTTGFEGTDEYTLQGVDLDEEGGGIARCNFSEGPIIVVNTPDAGVEGPHAVGANEKQIPARVKIDRWETERMSAEVTSSSAGYAVLRLMDYPAWRVTVNGEAARDLTRRNNGEMAVPVRAGENQIDVRWRTTWDQWAGIVLSLCGLAVTLALNWSERRKRVPVP